MENSRFKEDLPEVMNYILLQHSPLLLTSGAAALCFRALPVLCRILDIFYPIHQPVCIDIRNDARLDQSLRISVE
ncbi:Peroxygenase [Fusarium oxysporum f. sp. albedinis]|nr:Peroxygenase [Fusarium oxysporum f. sp. albedinis]